MHTATHTIHTLAAVNTEAAHRRADAQLRRQLPARSHRRGRTIAGTLAALVIGSTLAATPAVAAEYGGERLTPGMPDGWVQVDVAPTVNLVPRNVR